MAGSAAINGNHVGRFCGPSGVIESHSLVKLWPCRAIHKGVTMPCVQGVLLVLYSGGSASLIFRGSVINAKHADTLILNSTF
jgi:hypothetical protein